MTEDVIGRSGRDRVRGGTIVRSGYPVPEVVAELPSGGWRRVLALWGFTPVPFFGAFVLEERVSGKEGATE